MFANLTTNQIAIWTDWLVKMSHFMLVKKIISQIDKP